jgi:hypothetical protein
MHRFVATHGEVLLELGALSKANSRHWMGHRLLFSPAAYAALLGRDRDGIAQVVEQVIEGQRRV